MAVAMLAIRRSFARGVRTAEDVIRTRTCVPRRRILSVETDVHALTLLAALLLGFAVGLRTFTGPAVLWLVRHGGAWAYVLGALALLEYAIDLHPGAGARTQPRGLIPRIVSGAFCGWAVSSSSTGAFIAIAIVVGAVSAVIGAHVGLAARLKLIATIGRVPAAFVEDAVAIAVAVAGVYSG